MSSTSEMSTVSTCGQNGKPRSAMTSVLVCRTRLISELMAGFKIQSLACPDLHLQGPWNGLAGDYDEVPASAPREHGAHVPALVVAEDRLRSSRMVGCSNVWGRISCQHLIEWLIEAASPRMSLATMASKQSLPVWPNCPIHWGSRFLMSSG